MHLYRDSSASWGKFDAVVEEIAPDLTEQIFVGVETWRLGQTHSTLEKKSRPSYRHKRKEYNPATNGQLIDNFRESHLAGSR
jgi:hypothetical protein